MVIAGHPHHPQPEEKYQSKVSGRSHWIVYFLGDFLSYDIFKWSHLTAWLRVENLKGIYLDQNVLLGKSQATCIHRLELTPVYVEAIIRGKGVESLRFKKVHGNIGRRYTNSDNKTSQKEFEEVLKYWELCVQPSLGQST